MNADIETLKWQIRYLPPTARKRAERALGIASPKAEHKVFVYGTLLSNECNCNRAPRARRQNAWTLGTLHDTGYGFPAIVQTQNVSFGAVGTAAKTAKAASHFANVRVVHDAERGIAYAVSGIT